MLRLRDPADPTNDLGRKAFAIKHVQSTIRSLYHGLVIAVKQNERPSLLDILVGVKPGLDKARRQKLRNAGREMETQLAESLAAKAKRLREAEDSATLAELDQASEMTTSVSEQMRQDDEKRRIVRELRDRSWHDLTAERNKQLRPAAEKFATAAGIDVTKVDMDEFGSRYRTKWQINDSAVGESKPAETEGDQILSFLEDEQSTKKAEIPQIEVEHLAEEEASMDSTLADKT